MPHDVRRNNPLFLPENLERAAPLLEALKDVAKAHDATPAQVALAWVVRRPNVVAIPGASSVAQLEANVAAADLELTDEDDARLTEASDRFEPVRGRGGGPEAGRPTGSSASPCGVAVFVGPAARRYDAASARPPRAREVGSCTSLWSGVVGSDPASPKPPRRLVTRLGSSIGASRRSGACHRRSPGKKLVGVGFDRDRLEEAGIKDAFAVASVTNGDNSNIMIARVAKETYGIDRVVARIYDPRRAAIYERLGIPTVATVQWTIERVLRRILPESHAVEWIDPSAKVCLLERQVPAAWAGRDVAELEIDGEAKVIAVSRLGVSQLARPEPRDPGR